MTYKLMGDICRNALALSAVVYTYFSTACRLALGLLRPSNPERPSLRRSSETITTKYTELPTSPSPWSKTRVYQGEQTSLFLTLTNRGRVTSFQVNEEPGANKREEILAAQREQELEKQRTVAQDVSVLLLAENESAIDIKRAVAFPGSIREGQTSVRLEFPIEVYKNTKPGQYRLDAIANYTYQKDVAVKGDEDHPESPDVFYWYDSISQTIPITLTVERRSGAQFEILDISPSALAAGSKDNVVRIRIKNVGYDTAKDLVARLRPESGLYVSVDESPIAALPPAAGGGADLQDGCLQGCCARQELPSQDSLRVFR